MAVVPRGSVGSAISDAVEWIGADIDWLGNLLDPVGEILAKIWPPVVAVILTVALLRIVRWLLLVWRGRTPRVQISNFTWAMADDGGHEAAWVTSLFREKLAALRLDGLDPLPERAPGAPLVEIVEGVGQGVSRDIASAAGRIFKAVWPDSAYEVWATLRPREGSGGRISVQLIERRRGNRTLLNVALEEASWEDGAREAALAVGGALYPRVRRRDRGPWTLWNNTVPRQLLGHYHAARRFEEENCLEHALAEYHEALDLDPLNPNLRLKIAMLQERLELYLDAWVTYEAIVDESDRRAWRGPNRRVYLLALYRLAVMLSNGRLAAQWIKRSHVGEEEGSRRDQERQKHRDELLRALDRDPLFAASRRLPFSFARRTVRFTSTLSFHVTWRNAIALHSLARTIDENAEIPSDSLEVFRRPGVDETREDREHRIEVVLQLLGLRRLEELEFSLRFRPPLRPRNWKEWWIRHPPPRQWLKRAEFAKSAVRTSKLLVRTRTAASLEDQVKRHADHSEDFGDPGPWIREIRQAHRTLTRRWPFPPVSPWRSIIHFLAPRRRWANRRPDAWQLHYNAACATGSMLRSDSVLLKFEDEQDSEDPPSEEELEDLRPFPPETDRGMVVRRAIAQLEEYAFRAGSRRIAAQADWVAMDDPDLHGLRKTNSFALWSSHHLPHSSPQNPSERKTDVKRFTVRVVRDGARAFADSWRRRASQAYPDAAEVARWWHFEARVWSALGRASREHLSWQERLEWLGILEEWMGLAENEQELDFSHEARGAGAADSMSKGLFDALAELAGEPGSNGSGPDEASVLAWADRRAREVRAAHEDGEERADESGELRVETEHEEAIRAAKLWTRLAEALEVELATTGGEDSEEEDEEEKRRKEEEVERELQARLECVRGELPSARRFAQRRSNGRWRRRRP
jgi:tetratricopeptide (TPR) repeat protein